MMAMRLRQVMQAKKPGTLHIANLETAYSDRLYQTLTTFLGSVLEKKFTNPSSDTITILSGLDEVDQVFTEFVSVLDRTIRNGRDSESLPKAFEDKSSELIRG
jgi:Ca2+-binding EF-hand superfamily protein